jgi:site-specific DNA-cytosine methylase
MIARCEPECFHRAIYYIKNLSHKQGHNRKENVIVSTEKIRKTGGNNIPLVQQEEVICIAGNAIDRQPQNGGNGFGWQQDISYTLTATDRHSVYARQRVDQFRDDEIASTESARQHKDATDLICQPPSTWDTDCRNLIRRLTPLECERLQGYPDGWTDVPGASDSARYKALGNSVAIPCVEYLMQRVAMVITLDLEWDF